MNHWIRHSRAGRGIFATLLLLALVFRVFVPNGFMPVAKADGIVISLCASEGGTMLLAKGEGAPKQDHGKDSPCTFATGLGAGILPITLSFEPTWLPIPAILSFGAALADLTTHRLAAPPPPAQGPPLPR